jgi:hypothetical protein
MLVALCVAASITSPAVTAGSSSHAKLPVEVYNLAQLSPRNVRLSTDEAARLMREAGVELEWQFPTEETLPTRILNIGAPSPWELPENGRPVIVRIVRIAPHDYPSALGYALPATPEWVYAAVFDDRIEAVHYRNRVPYAALLGCAIAHEIGHLLLQTPEHSVRGLMKAQWDRHDLLDAACGRLTFNPEEQPRISRAVLRRLTPRRGS